MVKDRTIYKIKRTITVSGGTGNTTFSKSLNIGFNHILKHIIIVPTTLSTTYKYRLTESDSTIILDRTAATFTGRSATLIGVPLIGLITVTLTSVSADEDVDVTIYFSEP